MATPQNSTFIPQYCLDLSGFKFLSQQQLREYKTSWNTFSQVQLSNVTISTLRATITNFSTNFFFDNITSTNQSTLLSSLTFGNPNLSYYQFFSHEEQIYFTKGQFLHVQSYPASNWSSVPEN